MSDIARSEPVARRKALSLLGSAAAFAAVTSCAFLSGSEAEAQTAGMQRRQQRRGGRHERREQRRTGRTERREERRN
jgi:hypothetical protein